ncbi:MAG: bifunctional diaminohydroxyphosphoribosylaminopyrimidine deaminase/5-amino-6-(5-phosphoribosylamino)uracil reductase RibD [Desulfovibrionaceae bacterium]|nr:bifunctional diaminohydroxyphosphoribosylaminopyrimidine deaminase/5-amino-6-(5-phosphoribosylamino)uracil reductase RibD [Desulfovibrionaceae bacterium]
MREALALAEQGRWRAAPNPTVGAVLVRDGHIMARGWHAAYGRDHAETACLKDAAAHGVDPAQCTLVVTLEPCNHQGLTPPCTDAVLAAGIRHVVIGMADVNPGASGGAERLREAGVTVDMGVLEEECRDSMADFLVWQTTERPYVVLKMAATLDGRIATRSGHAQRISGEQSRQRVMALREGVGLAGGAVLVGGNTFALDNPRLTARTPTAARQPLAAVATSRLPGMVPAFHLIQERPQDCVFFSSAAQAASPSAVALKARGVRVYGLDRAPSGRGLDVGQLLATLRAEEHCLYVLCEGGARMGFSLLEQGVVDEFLLHLAPVVLGDEEAKPLFAGRHVDSIEEGLRMHLTSMDVLGGDVRLSFRPVRD